MPSRKQPRGVCGFCGRESTKGGLARHLGSCGARKDAVQAADAGSGRAMTIIHLRVQDGHRSEFWLDLEINGSAALRDLDGYLRAIWLEYCGHLSMFSEGGWGDEDELPMNAHIGRILKPGAELIHIYDFGDSSETRIKSVSSREGKPTGDRPIFLMSRNLPPAYGCAECERPPSAPAPAAPGSRTYPPARCANPTRRRTSAGTSNSAKSRRRPWRTRPEWACAATTGRRSRRTKRERRGDRRRSDDGSLARRRSPSAIIQANARPRRRMHRHGDKRRMDREESRRAPPAV